ncbi:MAG: hypothetical protein ACN2B6_05940 [Rickettsiales bacterium]
MADTTQTSKLPATAKAVKPRTGFINSIWADITAGVLTVGAGLVAARSSINNIFHKNIKLTPGVGNNVSEAAVGALRKQMPEKWDKWFAQDKIVVSVPKKNNKFDKVEIPELVRSKAETNYLNGLRQAASTPEELKAVKELTKLQKKRHASRYNEIIREELKVRNIGDKLEFVRPHQRGEIATKVGATMAVALGAVATVAALREIYDNQQELDTRLDKIEANGGERSL